MSQELKDKNRAVIRQALDATEHRLYQEYLSTVRQRQFGDKSANVELAYEKFRDFKDSKWRKEKEAIDAINSS
jgi:hypothetical protein